MSIETVLLPILNSPLVVVATTQSFTDLFSMGQFLNGR